MPMAYERVALVTGSSRGLGAAIARRLAQDGFAVAVNGQCGDEQAGEVGRSIRDGGGAADVFYADVTDEEQAGELVAAITGRLALIAEQWLGIDPDQVIVSLHDGPGWGRTELTGRGAERRLRVSLPPSWLARVWASGLARTAGHLVVAVGRGGWPDARVLAVRAPGREPVLLDVHARPHEGRDGADDAPHWEV